MRTEGGIHRFHPSSLCLYPLPAKRDDGWHAVNHPKAEWQADEGGAQLALRTSTRKVVGATRTRSV